MLSFFNSEMIFPQKNDPRWIFLIYAICFVVFALASPGFTRTAEQFLTAFATCITLDFLLLRFYKRIFLFPMSGLLSSFGIFLMCDAISVWPYFLAGVLTIFSKHFITIKGRHIFNPNNFAVVMLSLFLPSFVTVTAGRWGGMIEVMFALMIFGLLLAYKINRINLITSYIVTYLIGAWVRSRITHSSLLTIMGPGTGAAFQLFVFYHITDPKTTPNERRHQIVFGIFLGIIDAYLRLNQNKFAPFLSFFIMSGLYSFFKVQFQLDSTSPWKLSITQICWPKT